nr:uncharacterized protein LOC113715059 [Coffea arabica]
MTILQAYEQASGQLINLEKSSVIFSKNVSITQKQDVCGKLGGMEEVKHGRYLGLPMVISRSKEQVFGYIKENMNRRLESWKNRFLSQAGKEVMLKLVTMAVPIYAMSCFKLPRKLCKDLSSTMANYWWGEANGKNKMHWISWKKMAQERKEGGLNFKDLEAFNKALLGKQIWRFITKPNLLVSRVLKAKYFSKESIFTCKVPSTASWFWKGLMSVRDVLEEGVLRRIGNGISTKIWEHKWIPQAPNGKPSTTKPQNCKFETVQQLITNKRWNSNLVFRLFNKSDAMMILSIPVRLGGREDSHYWGYNEGGEYTVRSGYKRFMKESLGSSNSKKKAGTSMEAGSNQTKAIWKIAPITWEGADDQIGNFHRWWSRITEAKNRQDGRNHMGLTANILWQIWKDRNKREFENQAGYNPCSVIQKAHMEWLEIVELDSKKEPQSTTETVVPVEVDSVAPESHEGVNLRVAIKTSKRNAVLGIGVSVRRVPNEAQEVWALKDRSLGDHNIDEATTIKLTLCKALDRQWSTISVQIRNKGLLKLLKLGKASDCRMTTLIEDILSLKSLFRMCSFCLDNDDDNIDCNSVSSYAHGILLDEEFLVPPCS